MVYLQLLNRRRGLIRGRPRPSANSNFITIKKSGTVYSLTYPPLNPPLKFYLVYVAPQPQPIGYKNNPVMNPPYILIGAQTDPQSLIPQDLPVTQPPTPPAPPSGVIVPPIVTGVTIPQPSLPNAQSAVQVGAYDNGNSFQLVLTTSPKRLYQGATPSKTVVIIASSTNTGNIYIGFNPSVSNLTGVIIPKGSGVSIPISDAGKIYIVADNAGDIVSGFYLV